MEPALSDLFGIRSDGVLRGVDSNRSSTEDGAGGFLFCPGLPVLPAFWHKWSAKERPKAFVKDRHSSTAFEAWAYAMALRVFSKFCRGKRVLLEIDSAPAGMALDNAYSKRPAVMVHVRDARMTVAREHIVLRVRHILGKKFNQIADCLSHFRLAEARCLALRDFGLPLSLQ